MGEDILVLTLKLARVDENRNRLGVDDYAVLQCVSKSVAKQAKDVIENTECMQKAWRNTAFFLGFDSDFPIKSLGLGHQSHCGGDLMYSHENMKKIKPQKISSSNELVVDANVVMRTFIKVRRLLFTLETNDNSKKKLVNLLNELTLKVAKDTFSPRWTWNLEAQTNTIRSLLNCFKSRHIELRVLAGFFTFYCISLCLELKRSETCILCNQRFRETAIASATSTRADLREKITLLPYGFTEKIMRILTLVSNKLNKW